MSLKVTSDSKNDSGVMKRFFRNFSKFSAPGMIFHKMLTSLNIRQFRLILHILAISQKFLIFQCPLKSGDECWHRSYKKFETFNYFIITLEKIMEKFDDNWLMFKNTWGGTGGLSPPPAPELHFIRTYDLHENPKLLKDPKSFFHQSRLT